jgi:hypothetical protein
MSNAVEKIVDTYVQLNDSRALEDLWRYRQELAVLLKAQTGLDFSLLIGQIDAEIAVIEAGLDRFKARRSQRRSFCDTGEQYIGRLVEVTSQHLIAAFRDSARPVNLAGCVSAGR